MDGVEDEFTEITDADISRVDLVDKAANGLSFLIAKGEEGDPALLDPELVRELAKADDAEDPDGQQSEGEVEKAGEPDPTAPPAATGAPDVPEESAVSDELTGLLAQVEAAKAALEDLEKRTFTAQQRHDAAQTGAALPDGSFPIENSGDLDDAVNDVGRASNHSHAEVHDHIMARAKSLGLTDRLPSSWGGGKKKSAVKSADTDEVPTETVEEIVKAAVAEAGNAHREQLDALRAELAEVRKTAIPGGPFLLAPGGGGTTQKPPSRVEEVRAFARSLHPDVAADYHAYADRLEREERDR